MRKILCVFLAICFLFCGSLSVSFAADMAGHGTEESPYLVTCYDEFLKIAEEPGAHYKLTKDIVLSSAYPMINGFFGVLDGDGHSITMNINSGTDDTGLFSVLKQAEIKNLFLKGTVSGKGNVGALAGQAAGNAVIKNCVNEAAVTGTGSNVGGLIGKAENVGPTIDQCKNYGEITGHGTTGGFVGRLYSGSAAATLTNSYNYGSVTSIGSHAAGIIALTKRQITLKYCGNYGAVTATNGNAGGIASWTYADASECFNEGNVTATARAGGIFSASWNNDQVVSNCYNTGTIKGGQYTGGIVSSREGASVAGTAKMSYNRGAIGGGGQMAPISVNWNLVNCYFSGADGLSDEQMKSMASFAGFSADVWEIDPDSEYPYPTLKNARPVRSVSLKNTVESCYVKGTNIDFQIGYSGEKPVKVSLYKETEWLMDAETVPFLLTDAPTQCGYHNYFIAAVYADGEKKELSVRIAVIPEEGAIAVTSVGYLRGTEEKTGSVDISAESSAFLIFLDGMTAQPSVALKENGNIKTHESVYADGKLTVTPNGGLLSDAVYTVVLSSDELSEAYQLVFTTGKHDYDLNHVALKVNGVSYTDATTFSAGDTISAELTIQNLGASKQDFIYFIAVYGAENELLDIAVDSGEIAPGSTGETFSTKELNLKDGDCSVRVFVWNNFTNKLPISEQWIFE